MTVAPDSIALATAALATLTVAAGINLTPGEPVVIAAKLGQEDLARALATACYQHGAHQVQVDYGDPWISRARYLHAPEAALGDVLPWVRARPEEMAKLRCAWIGLSGPAAPGLMDDVDPGRIGRDAVALKEWGEVIDRRAISWSIIPGPTDAWARLVFPDAGDDALAALWQSIWRICRLDEPDPAQAWWERNRDLAAATERMDAAPLTALRFQGPGTDLTVGLAGGVHWSSGGMTTAWGVRHMANLPTEEVFTSPDAMRTEGVVTSTKPLLVSGRTVNGLRVRFEGGRAVQIDADDGAELIRELVRRDPDADRLGEVALVDESGRVGASGVVFHDTLLDENAASHIALGAGFRHLADDQKAAERINSSGVHTDFMIGGPAVDVTGITADGQEIPVLMGERWALD